jgi:hypothetical protein
VGSCLPLVHRQVVVQVVRAVLAALARPQAAQRVQREMAALQHPLPQRLPGGLARSLMARMVLARALVVRQ